MEDFRAQQQRPYQPQTNGLGIAGFVISLVGLCASGGLLSPVGLIISLVALNRQPRGFAVAGVVLGALGSCGLILGIVALVSATAVVGVVLAGLGLAGLAAVIAGMSGPEIEGQIEMAVLTANLEKTYDKANAYPATLAEGTSGLDANSGLFIDHWERPYIYQQAPDGQSFRLYSLGEDGIAATRDDIESKAAIEVSSNHSSSPITAPPATDVAAPQAPAPTEETPEPTAPAAPL